MSASHDNLMGAIGKLLLELDTLECDNWFVSRVMEACKEAVDKLEDNQDAKGTWSDMGSPDDAFSIDIFCADDAKFVRHNGNRLLAPHGAVGFVADKLQELWIYDETEIGDYDNVMLPKPIDVNPISTNQLRDIIANHPALDMAIVNHDYARVHSDLTSDGYQVTLDEVTSVVDAMASKDEYFVRLAKACR